MIITMSIFVWMSFITYMCLQADHLDRVRLRKMKPIDRFALFAAILAWPITVPFAFMLDGLFGKKRLPTDLTEAEIRELDKLL